MGEVHHLFREPHTESREFIAPDGRRWCARSYLDPLCRNKPVHGKDYTPSELVRLYGLRVRDGRPGFFLRHGETMPASVCYLVTPLGVGE